MTAHKKIAVTVPAETYKALERARGKLGKSRSEVVSLAISDWLQSLQADAARKRYVAGYLSLPETTEDMESVLRIAAAATADWSTWEPGPGVRASESRGRKRR